MLPTPIAPASLDSVRPLLGPVWLLEGEDHQLYEQLLTEIAAAIAPRDIIDWLMVQDIASLTWEIQRSRRHRQSLARRNKQSALETLLISLLATEKGYPDVAMASALALSWANGVKASLQKVDALLRKAGMTMADVDSQTLSDYAKDFERIDAQAQRFEERRSKLLRLIERRRAGAAAAIRRAGQKVIEAEFHEA